MKDQILYFWVHKTEYLCFDNNEFNFSPDYQFHFDYSNRVLKLKFSKAINVFDKEKNLSNITAIVGNNGTGKTTLLKLLLNCNPRSAAKISHNFTYAENKETAIILVYLENEEIKIINATWKEIKYVDDDGNEFVIGSKADFSGLNYTRLYISSDSKTNKSLFLGSNNFLFSKESNLKLAITPWQFKSYGIRFSSAKTSGYSELKPFNKFDLEKYVLAHFMCEYHNKLSFVKDKGLYISIGTFAYGSLRKNQREIMSSIFKTTNQQKINESYEPIQILLLNLLSEIRLLESGEYNQAFADIIGNDISLQSIKYYLEHINCHNYQYYQTALDEIELFQNSIVDYNQLIEASSTHKKIMLCDYLKLNNLFNYVVNSEHSFIFKYLNIELEGSDGELAYLKHLAYLFFAKNIRNYLPNEKVVLSKNILIELDEIDVHLHPEWQRQLINNILNFLKDVFKEYNIQLLFTTHSPIVLSDIPSNNILYLRRTDSFSKIVEKRDNKTFGSNIYSLYNDSFFFNNESLIGEYAKNYINSLYDLIKNNNYDNDLAEKIELIGEPILRNELKRLARLPINNDKVMISSVNNFNTILDDLDTIKKYILSIEKKINDD